ncbi:hypothetical protein M3Y95_00317100 [Aphelenchoides besseyi]|nr:hypothetical protein M3Y95_00317100 [Aphelenchoides besseyi]
MALSKVKPQIVLLFGVVVGFLFGNYNSKTSSEVNQTEINVAKFVGLSGVKLQQSDSAKPTGISGYMNHPECPHGYTEEDFRKQNSGKLPARNWTYGPKGICENDDAKNCLASFIPVKELPTIFTATPAKFGACSVRKSMSRIMRQIACMLTNPLNYLLLGWDLIDSAFGTECSNFPNTEIYSLYKGEELGWTKENGWVYTMVTKEPVDRFLSGYLYQCVMKWYSRLWLQTRLLWLWSKCNLFLRSCNTELAQNGSKWRSYGF